MEVASARITDDKSTFNYGESAAYECNPGYEFKDGVSNGETMFGAIVYPSVKVSALFN